MNSRLNYFVFPVLLVLAISLGCSQSTPRGDYEHLEIERIPRLGIRVINPRRYSRGQENREMVAGVEVITIYEQGRVAGSPLNKHDLIFKVNEYKIDSPRELRELVNELNPNKPWSLSVYRGAETLNVTLAPRDDSE